MRYVINRIQMLALVAVLLLMPQLAKSQQHAQFSQYMFNGLSINPAYAGSHESMSATVLGRWQWVGIEGAPETNVFSIHAPIPGKSIAVGLQLVNDKIGLSQENNFQASFAYRIKLRYGTLAMGISGGVSDYRIDYNRAETVNNDPNQVGVVRQMLPSFGAGLFYYTSNTYLSISSPILTNSTVKDNGSSVYQQAGHYFVMGGVIIDVNRNLKIRPNFLVKLVDGAPITYNLNVNTVFRDMVWVGVSYRPKESVNFLLELKLTNQLRVGYAMDVLTGPVSEFARASNEIMINYRFPLGGGRKVAPYRF